jgi:HK97 family phage major capsid protein
MSTFDELKAMLEKDASQLVALKEKLDARDRDDAVRKDEIKKLEAAIAETKKERQDLEIRLNTELSEAKKLATEAAAMAGRKSAAGEREDAAAIEHKQQFLNYLRRSKDPTAFQALKDAERKAVQTTVGTDGGLAVPEVIARDIQRKALNASIFRDLVKVVQVGTSDYRELVDKNGMAYGWVGETGTRAETSTPGLFEVTPVQGTIYAYPKATEESMDDIFFDVEKWLIESASRAFAVGKDTEIVSGNGTNKPLGFLAGTPVTTADGARADKVIQYLPTGAAGAFGASVYDNLNLVLSTLKAAYRESAVWVMNSLTAMVISNVKTTDGMPIWRDGFVAGNPATLLGRPVRISENIPAIAANSFSVVLGDFKAAYTLVERHGLRVTRDEVTTPGYVKWNIRERVGGAPTNDDAIKLLKFAVS